jgi:hypothetical protein
MSARAATIPTVPGPEIDAVKNEVEFVLVALSLRTTVMFAATAVDATAEAVTAVASTVVASVVPEPINDVEFAATTTPVTAAAFTVIVTVFAAVVEYKPEFAAVSLKIETVTVPTVGVLITTALEFAAVTTVERKSAATVAFDAERIVAPEPETVTNAFWFAVRVV